MFSCYQLCVSEILHWIIVCFIACYLCGHILRTCFPLSLYCTVRRIEGSSFECYIYSAGFSYMTTCNLQTIIEIICSVIIPNPHKVYLLQKLHSVQRGLQRVEGCLLFSDLDVCTLGSSMCHRQERSHDVQHIMCISNQWFIVI